MKAKKLLTLLTWILLIGNSYAQESESSSFAVKNYFSVGIEKDDIDFQFANETYSLKDSNQVLDFQLILPAFNIFTKHGHLHEFEISEFQFSNEKKSVLTGPLSTDSISTTEIHDFEVVIRRFSFRYHYGIPIIKNSNFTFYLGGSIQPYWSKDWRHSLPDDFPYSETELKTQGVNIHLTPQLMYSFNEHLFFEFNTLIPILKQEKAEFRQKNDGEDFIQKNDLHQFLNGVFRFSIGIGYKF